MLPNNRATYRGLRIVNSEKRPRSFLISLPEDEGFSDSNAANMQKLGLVKLEQWNFRTLRT